ncbi:MAG: hypothetical protein D084_Lepto4C00208G0001 [Leptospirillum sp. Group IV 'UBA BS']|nr:MAG: hypothetical protein D084_Lepto4C00208G0001 [Leptospirillum sp. Group IV 'UBA BS']
MQQTIGQASVPSGSGRIVSGAPRILFGLLGLVLFPLLLVVSGPDPSWGVDIDNQDALPDFSGQSDVSTAESVNPLGAPGQILFQADIGFVPASGPTVTGAIGNEGLGTGFLVGIEGGYTIYKNLALTAGISVHAFGNDTNVPLMIGAQYFFANGGGFPMTVANNPINIVPYLEFAFGPAFNSSTASNGVGVGTTGFAFRVGPGIMIPFGTVKHQGLFFEIDYENQSGPFSGAGLSSSSVTLVPVKVGYITLF